MNTVVQDFINKKKQEQREKELKQREAHLASLGLVSGNRKIYLDEYDGGPECFWDDEHNCWCRNAPIVADITDEEYQEILKYAPISEKVEVKTKWAGIIETVADIMLFLSSVGGMILAFVLLVDDYTTSFSWIHVILAIQYCILWYPLIMGFSKIVAVAEKNL